VDNSDYLRYLNWLEDYSAKYGLYLLAYCLIPNHIHVVAAPEKANSMAKVFNVCHMQYSQYFNKKNERTGHLWQGRFFSCALDEKHLYSAIRYIENNPVRAKLVKKTGDWKWSSAKTHLNSSKSVVSLADVNKYIDVSNWSNYLAENEDQTLISKIKAHTLTGRPLGNKNFIKKLEKRFNTRLKAFPRGRPKKEQ